MATPRRSGLLRAAMWRGATLATLALAGCRRAVAPEQVVAIPCPPAVAPAATWDTVTLTPFRMRVPHGFVRDTTFRCLHGGEFYVRGRDRVGYCYGHYGTVTPTNAPHEVRTSFLGAPAIMECARSAEGWGANLANVGQGIRVAAGASARDRATLGMLVGVLQDAAPVAP